MASVMQQIAIAVGTTNTTIYDPFTDATKERGTLIHLNFCNTTAAAITVDVFIDLATDVYIVKTLSVPAIGQVSWSGAITVDAGGKKVLLRRAKDGTVTAEDVVERPATVSAPKGDAAKPGWYPVNDAPVPDCTEDEAVELGKSDYQNDAPITKNPFPYGDGRRRFWDEGWRKASGTDGMGK